MQSDQIDGETAQPDDDGVDELETRLRPTVQPPDLDERDDAEAKAEQDGEEEDSTRDVIAPDVTQEVTIRH